MLTGKIKNLLSVFFLHSLLYLLHHPSSFSLSLPRNVSHWRFAHKQVLHNEQQKRTEMNNRTVRDKKVPRGNTHTLCRTDAEGKVRALVRAGITDTLSCCVHPVHHVHLHTRSVSSNPRFRAWSSASHQSISTTFTYSTGTLHVLI